jgi:hypothetical protein
MGQTTKRPFTRKSTSAGRFTGINTVTFNENGFEFPYMIQVWFGRLRFHLFYRGDPAVHLKEWLESKRKK